MQLKVLYRKKGKNGSKNGSTNSEIKLKTSVIYEIQIPAIQKARSKE